MSFLTLLLLLGCTQEPLIGGDKDEHGCVATAGYTWCEVKQKCLREWEEPCIPTPPTDPAPGNLTTGEYIYDEELGFGVEYPDGWEVFVSELSAKTVS